MNFVHKDAQTEAQLKAAFAKVDIDGDGFLTLQELKDYFRNENQSRSNEEIENIVNIITITTK